MPRVIHFEIPPDKPERTVHFYREAFGWEIIKWEGPVDYSTGLSPPARIVNLGSWCDFEEDEGQATTNIIDVPSVDEFIEKIINAGGKVLLQKIAIPGIGWQAYCLDTEGNAFGIHQVDPDAR